MNTERINTNIAALVKQGKYDQAIDDLIEHLNIYPNDIHVRKLMRGTQIKRLRDPRARKSAAKKFTSRLSLSFGGAGGGEKRMTACERALAHDPLNPSLLKKLGAAAHRVGHIETAILAYETAREQKPKDPDALKALYKVYADLAGADEEKRRLYVNARERCAEYLKVKPGDRKARRDMERLTAEAAIYEGAWESTERFSEHLAKAPAELERAPEDRMMSAEGVASVVDDLRDQVNRAPQDAELRKRLADLCVRQQDYEGAVEHYKVLTELDPENAAYADMHGDMVLRSLVVKTSHLKKILEANAEDDQTRKELDALAARRTAFGIEEFQRRLRHRPTDLNVRLHLALFLAEAGRTDEALKEFQQCQSDQRYRAQALYGMGRCLEAKGMTEFAIDQLRKAQEAAPPGGGRFLEITYGLGEMLEKQQQWREAEAEYKKVFELDIGFRDVSERLETVYKMARASD